MDGKDIIVVKYGGSAFRTPEDFQRVIDHQRRIYEGGNRPVSVNSARGGVSDRLLDVWNREAILGEYADVERDFYSEVFRNRMDRDSYMNDLEGGFKSMEEAMKATPGHGHGNSDENHNESYFLSHGETEAGLALQYLLRDFKPDMRFVDGFEAGVVATSMRGPVDVKRSVSNIRARKGDYCYGGFVGRDPGSGKFYCLLDRNSTDVSAALVAAALGAYEYRNIKDVDGVFVCDPGVLEDDETPKVISQLSYVEAENITRSGSPVIHPNGIIISKDHGIRIRITSLDNGGQGTIISEDSGTSGEHPYAAISSGIYACLTVSDATMNIPAVGRGYASAVMDILARAGYDILSPTGPGTAMSIVVAGGNEVRKDREVDVGDLCSAVTDGLMEMGRSPKVDGRNIGYISLTGAGMRNRTGTVCEIGKIMADAGINISGIDAGDDHFVDTPVISLFVDPKDYRTAVNALRKELF